MQRHLEDTLTKYLTAAASDMVPQVGGANGNLLSPPVLLGLCCSISVLEAVQDVAPPSHLHSFTPALVKCMTKSARDAVSQAGQQQQQGRPRVARCVCV